MADRKDFEPESAEDMDKKFEDLQEIVDKKLKECQNAILKLCDNYKKKPDKNLDDVRNTMESKVDKPSQEESPRLKVLECTLQELSEDIGKSMVEVRRIVQGIRANHSP